MSVWRASPRTWSRQGPRASPSTGSHRRTVIGRARTPSRQCRIIRSSRPRTCAHSRVSSRRSQRSSTLPARATSCQAWRGRRLILHAGPPIAWPRMCGPMRGAVQGAAVFEGWADSVAAASALVESGSIELSPCHHHAAVGPMAGIISPSMPVFVIENRTAGNRAYSQHERRPGQGAALRRARPGGDRAPAFHGGRARAGAARCARAYRPDRA